MRFPRLHAWDLTPSDAIALQKDLARRVVRGGDRPSHFRLVAGVDASCSRFSDELFCGVVVFDRRTGEIVDSAGSNTRSHCPYIPGLLSFREAPGILDAFEKLALVPDVVLVDGAGVAHPRRLGLASHLGLWLDLPTIGCAKSRLVGAHREPARGKGSYRRLVCDGEVIGRVLRTRDGVNPLYVSVGHRISLDQATRLVLSCCRGYRLPEPTRQAHRFVNDLRRRGFTDRLGIGER